MKEILVTSLVSNKNQLPRIDITFPSNRIQLSAEEALNFTKQLLECIEGSYADSFLYNWLLNKIFNDQKTEQNLNILVQMLQDFREFREKLKIDFDSYQKRE